MLEKVKTDLRHKLDFEMFNLCHWNWFHL